MSQRYFIKIIEGEGEGEYFLADGEGHTPYRSAAYQYTEKEIRQCHWVIFQGKTKKFHRLIPVEPYEDLVGEPYEPIHD